MKNIFGLFLVVFVFLSACAPVVATPVVTEVPASVVAEVPVDIEVPTTVVTEVPDAVVPLYQVEISKFETSPEGPGYFYIRLTVRKSSEGLPFDEAFEKAEKMVEPIKEACHSNEWGFFRSSGEVSVGMSEYFSHDPMDSRCWDELDKIWVGSEPLTRSDPEYGKERVVDCSSGVCDDYIPRAFNYHSDLNVFFKPTNMFFLENQDLGYTSKLLKVKNYPSPLGFVGSDYYGDHMIYFPTSFVFKVGSKPVDLSDTVGLVWNGSIFVWKETGGTGVESDIQLPSSSSKSISWKYFEEITADGAWIYPLTVEELPGSKKLLTTWSFYLTRDGEVITVNLIEVNAFELTPMESGSTVFGKVEYTSRYYNTDWRIFLNQPNTPSE